MATNIDKALYNAPQGIEDLAEMEPAIEVEIEDPEEVRISADGMEISLHPVEEGEIADEFDSNLAESLPSSSLATLVSDLASDIDNDKSSRKEWEKAYTEGLKLLGLQIEERTEPWNGACGVFHPMITEAIVRFQSEMITETFPAAGPVKTKIVGKETPEVKESAVRVQDDMNFELTEVMKEFRPEHERMLWSLPATGSAFKKVYYDPNLGRQVSMFVPAEDIILPYGTTDLDTCYRVTHVMRKTKNEILKLQEAGFYRDIELGDPDRTQTDIQKAKDKETGFSDLNDERFTLLECHVDLYIKEDSYNNAEYEIAVPYVVTLIKGSNDILSIRRNWNEDDGQKLKRQHFVHYQYIPGFGAYGFGLFHLIGGFAKSATSLIRQLVDAGTLSNLPGGLKSRGLRIKGDDTPIAPGEFRDVDVGSGTIRDNILPLPYKEPSAVLYQLLGNIVEEGRRFAATADMKVSDMSAQAPVGTTLAILERQLKVLSAVQARTHFSLKQELKLLGNIVEEGRRFAATADMKVSDMSAQAPVGTTLAILERQLKVLSAVQARTHFSLKQELKLLKGLIRDYTPDEYTYDPEYGTKRAKQSDYDAVDVIPVSDPNAATLSQRVVQYQAVIQMAQMAPQIYDLPQLHRSMLDVLGIKNAEKLVPLPDDEKPTDPVTENQQLLRGKPLKAFFYQDHAAHIAVHNMMIQDPMIAAQLGQNPMAQQMLASLQAHIAEHVGFQMRQQIEARMGTPLPPEDEKLPPQIELALSGMMAKAAQQMVAMDQAKMAQMQAMQQAQDPVVQMQQQELALRQKELQIKEQEVAIKAQKAIADAMVDQAKLKLDEKKTLGTMQLEAIKTGTQVQQSRQKAASEAEKLRAQAQSDDKKLAAQARQQLMNSLSRAQTPPKGDSNK